MTKFLKRFKEGSKWRSDRYRKMYRKVSYWLFGVSIVGMLLMLASRAAIAPVMAVIGGLVGAQMALVYLDSQEPEKEENQEVKG